jgi:PilZ domain
VKPRGQTELRRHPRRPFSRLGWIDVGRGAALRLCTINDLSETGAGISLQSEEELPVQFDLFFAPRRGVGRRCRVVWKSGHEVGCKFTHRFVGAVEVQTNVK